MTKKAIKLPKSIVRSIRLSSTLWEKISKSAKINHRSINAELMVWLEKVQKNG